MANKATITKFNKVTGWSTGPLKPTSSVTSGSASTVKSAIDSAITDIGDLTDNECIMIIVEHED